MKQIHSDFLAINWYDTLKAFVVGVETSVFTALLGYLDNGQFPQLAQLKVIGIVGLAAGLSYVIKQFFSNRAGQLAKTDDTPRAQMIAAYFPKKENQDGNE